MLRTIRRSVVAAALALGALLASPPLATAHAQDLSGVRVRLWSSTPPLSGTVGTISSVGSDSMEVLLNGYAAPVAVPLASVLRLQTSRGDRADNVARWLRWGMLGGAVVGAAVGAARSPGEEGGAAATTTCGEATRCDHAVRAGLIGLGIGAIVGGAFGGITGSERWEDVKLPSRVR